MLLKKILNTLTAVALVAGLSAPIQAIAADEVVVYSARAEHLIKPVFEKFTAETGIQVKYFTGKDAALIERLKVEGAKTPADMLITVDAGNLWYAAEQGIFQPFDSSVLKNVPNHLRDPDNLWTGLSIRARTIVYSTDRVNPSELSTYEDLASNKWADRLCLRTSKKVYNKSLVAGLIAHHGENKARQIVEGWVDNLAINPVAKDTHVVDAILAGQCDVGIMNTYYFGRMQAKNPDIKAKLFWANQNTTGTHVNVSGAGLTKHAKNKAAAQQLLTWLTSDKAQVLFAGLNKEYPVKTDVPLDRIVESWGEFKQDELNLAEIGRLQQNAVRLNQRARYR